MSQDILENIHLHMASTRWSNEWLDCPTIFFLSIWHSITFCLEIIICMFFFSFLLTKDSIYILQQFLPTSLEFRSEIKVNFCFYGLQYSEFICPIPILQKSIICSPKVWHLLFIYESDLGFLFYSISYWLVLGSATHSCL